MTMPALLKVVAALSVLLFLSLAGNGLAVYRLGYVKADRAAELSAAKRDGEIAALRGRADQVNRVAAAAEADNQKLWADLALQVDRGRERVVVYRTKLQQLPPLPANCGPGSQRVQAVNQLTGATP